MFRHSVFTTSALAITASLLAAGTVNAQERQSAIDALTDEIVVTATKKSDAENVQDVPISASAVTSRFRNERSQVSTHSPAAAFDGSHAGN